LTTEVPVGTILHVPINHFEGNYTCSPETLADLRGDERVVFRYVDNPNGSIDDIAGICSTGRNVVGLMPHPERACDELTGSADGFFFMDSGVTLRPRRGRLASRASRYRRTMRPWSRPSASAALWAADRGAR